jgi:hypothetical protein
VPLTLSFSVRAPTARSTWTVRHSAACRRREATGSEMSRDAGPSQAIPSGGMSYRLVDLNS